MAKRQLALLSRRPCLLGLPAGRFRHSWRRIVEWSPKHLGWSRILCSDDFDQCLGQRKRTQMAVSLVCHRLHREWPKLQALPSHRSSVSSHSEGFHQLERQCLVSWSEHVTAQLQCPQYRHRLDHQPDCECQLLTGYHLRMGSQPHCFSKFHRALLKLHS